MKVATTSDVEGMGGLDSGRTTMELTEGGMSETRSS